MQQNFIVDAQLSKKLSDFLKRQGYDSVHTLDLPEKNKTKDSSILAIAKAESRIVISKDLDFLESFLVKQEPSKLILVRTGNIPNKRLLNIFSANIEIIIKMITRSNFIEIGIDEIVEHA